jgi:hypothetical protein
MKSLILNLKKKLLIIDYETEEKFDQAWHSYSIPCIFTFHTDGSRVKPLFNGLELTEKYVEDLVFRSKIGNYKDYNYKEGTLDFALLDALLQMKFKTPTESFISAIESLGWHWLLNPLGEYRCESGYNGKLKNSCIDSCQGSCWDIDSDEWEEAESKTLRFPIIFEILK